MSIILRKYHGLGNDYLVLDPYKNDFELTPARVRYICDRHFGIGSDGILYGPILKGDDISLKIYNPDGSEAENSGNGVRIFAHYLRDAGYVTDKKFSFNTPGGEIKVECLNEDSSETKVALGEINYMDDPKKESNEKLIGKRMMLDGLECYVTCLTIGNPHCVIPMENISAQMVREIGEYIERSEIFAEPINTNVMEVVDKENIKLETYERGAGYTLASGTSATVAASEAFRMGLTGNKVTVHMPGGELSVEIAEDGTVFMSGPVTAVCTTCLSSDFEKLLMAL